MVIFRHGVFKPAFRFAEVYHFAFICVELEKPLDRPVLEGFQVALEFVTVVGVLDFPEDFGVVSEHLDHGVDNLWHVVYKYDKQDWPENAALWYSTDDCRYHR